MIVVMDLIRLIAERIDDSHTWVNFSQMNKATNKLCKSLIRKEQEYVNMKGESTKKDKPGFIGEKGIGFKAVFSVSDRVEVHSNGFHIRFDVAKRGPLGMVIPDWVARPLDHAQAMTHSSLSSPGFTRDHLHEMKWNTEILLPLIDVRRREPLADQLGMISPLLLLFLQRLRSMVLSSSHSAFNAAVFLCWLFLWCFCNYLLSTFELLPLLL